MTVTNNGSRNRQADYRRRMYDAGFIQVAGWVHADQAADTMQLLRRLQQDAALRPGPLRNIATGKLHKLEL